MITLPVKVSIPVLGPTTFNKSMEAQVNYEKIWLLFMVHYYNLLPPPPSHDSLKSLTTLFNEKDPEIIMIL